MYKFVAVIFPDEAQAYKGLQQLQELHAEGSVTVFGTVVVERVKDGTLSIKRRTGDGPLGTGVGAVTGALIGLLGGPVGAAAGAAGGGLLGAWRDYLSAETSDEFIESLTRDLTPGNFALIAEVAEEWIAPVDTRMESLDGKVVREPRQAVLDDWVEKQIDARKDELDQRKQERATAKAERMERKLSEQVDDAAQRLQRAADKAKERLDHTKEEMDAKLSALEEQAAKANPEVRSRIESRISELHKDFGERKKKLERAFEISREALQP